MSYFYWICYRWHDFTEWQESMYMKINQKAWRQVLQTFQNNSKVRQASVQTEAFTHLSHSWCISCKPLEETSFRHQRLRSTFLNICHRSEQRTWRIWGEFCIELKILQKAFEILDEMNGLQRLNMRVSEGYQGGCTWPDRGISYWIPFQTQIIASQLSIALWALLTSDNLAK